VPVVLRRCLEFAPARKLWPHIGKEVGEVAELAVAIGNYRLVFWVLVHQTWRAKMVHQGCSALNSSVCNFADLVALEALPTLARKLFRKRNNAERIRHIQKCIPKVALVPRVYGQIKEVVRARVALVNEL
jgi:hypothetical protein